MSAWGPSGIPAWLSTWADMLSVLADPLEPKAHPLTYEDGTHWIKPESFNEEHVEESVSDLREDLEVLTPDDLTKGRGR